MTHALSSREIGSAWKFHRDRYDPKTRAEVRAIAIARVDYGGRVARPKSIPRKLEIEIARASVANKVRDPEGLAASRITRDQMQRVRRACADILKQDEPPVEIVARKPAPYVPPVKPDLGPVPNPDASAVPAWRRGSNQRKTLIAMECMVYRDFHPTLDQACDIFALFGSYEAFIKAAHAERTPA